MPYRSGTVTVTTSATPVCVPGAAGVVVQNLGAVAVTFGPAGVVAGGGTQLPASNAAPVWIPGSPDSDDPLFAVAASATAPVTFLTAG
jgi:hypothetical protein